MPTVADIAISLGPLWVIDQRLEFHSLLGSGRILDGIKYDREGKLEIDGRKDLPQVQPITLSDTEDWAPGAAGIKSMGTQTAIKTSIAFTLLVQAKREYGLFQRDPTATLSDNDKNYKGTGVLEWAARVRDAIERTTDGMDKTDSLLEQTISKPILTTITDAPVSDLAWSVLVQLQIDIESICRGARSITP